MGDRTLRRAFIDELREIYGAEKQLVKAGKKFARAASSPELRKAFDSHLEETTEQVSRLERVFAMFKEKPRGKRCDAIAAILDQRKTIIDSGFEKSTLDAYLIAASQRIEHYEIAVYGTLIVWARTLENDDAAELLEDSLDEEKAADEKLSSLADNGINDAAAEDTD